MYYGNGREDFYGIDKIKEIEEKTGLKVITSTYNQYTEEELKELYKSCFIHLRLTQHDGLPNTIIEMGMMGRRSIYNGGLPNCYKWKDINDVCRFIKYEYNNRLNSDINKISKDMKDYLLLSKNWNRL